MSDILNLFETNQLSFLNEIHQSIFNIINDNKMKIKINEYGGVNLSGLDNLKIVISKFNKLPFAIENKILLIERSSHLHLFSESEDDFFSEMGLNFYKNENSKLSVKLSSVSIKRLINENNALDIYLHTDETSFRFLSKGYFVAEFKINHANNSDFSKSSNLDNIKQPLDRGLNTFFSILTDMQKERKEDVINYLFKGKDFSQEEKDFFLISQDLNIDDYKFLQIDLNNKNEINYKPKISDRI